MVLRVKASDTLRKRVHKSISHKMDGVEICVSTCFDSFRDQNQVMFSSLLAIIHGCFSREPQRIDELCGFLRAKVCQSRLLPKLTVKANVSMLEKETNKEQCNGHHVHL